jgi:hypothetical protein
MHGIRAAIPMRERLIKVGTANPFARYSAVGARSRTALLPDDRKWSSDPTFDALNWSANVCLGNERVRHASDTELLDKPRPEPVRRAWAASRRAHPTKRPRQEAGASSSRAMPYDQNL